MRVAVIIPFRGSGGILAWALDGYAQQELATDIALEVRVGLDGGDAPTAAIEGVKSVGGRVLFGFHSFERCGAAEIRNRLVAMAPADVLIFANGDCRPFPDFVH